MRLRQYLQFALTTTFLLFYPGQNIYYQLVTLNKNFFSQNHKPPKIRIQPIPYAISNYSPALTATGAFIVDLTTYTPVYKKNSDVQFFPASTTKIITALVAVDIYKPDDVITVSDLQTEGQKMELVKGERITAENLLYGILVHSGNDAAYALANHYGYDKFIILMNEKAQKLGMKNSLFTNPAGLDDMRQKTTPADLALAGRALIRNPYLRKMVGTKEIIISDIDYSIFHRLVNVNKLLGVIQGIGGLKTGYTENAGENLVSFYRHNGHDYLIIVLNSQDRFIDTKEIVYWIEGNITYHSPTEKL